MVSPKVRRYAEELIEKYDANHSGQIEEEEWAKMEGSPAAIDADKSGAISLDELLAYLSKYSLAHRINVASPTPSLSVSGLSGPPSGAPAEAAITPETAEGVAPESNPDEAKLDSLDRERTSTFRRTPRSLQKFYIPPTSLPQGLPEWFLSRDGDGDGQLTLREYSPGMIRSEIDEFYRYDLDRDGVITAQEASKFGSPRGLPPRP